MNVTTIGWSYIKSTLFGDSPVGPLADGTFLQLAFDGKIKPKTLVIHPTHTRNQWVNMEQIPAARKRYEDGEQSRRESKDEQQRERERLRKEQIADEEARRQHAIEEASERTSESPIAHLLLDGQPEAVVAKIAARVEEILTPQETIQYIAVQAKPIAIAPDCIAITNRRLIVFHQKMLGQMHFEDYLWMHLHDAKITEGILFADVWFRTTDGQVVNMGYLPKVQARRVYRVAQQREEDAIEVRRARWMEEQRAGASNLVVNATTPAPTVPQSVQSSESDPVEKLQQLKKMLDAGLIAQSEYDATKARILSAM